MKGTVYDKYVKIHNEIRRDFPKFNKQDFFKITAKLSTWHYPKKRGKGQTLTKEEAMIYEWLLNNSYNPSTVYKWLLALNTNKDNHQRLQKGVLSLKKTMKYSQPFKHITEVESEFMYHVKKCFKHYIIR
jgi:hypothetical protein